MSKKGVSIHLKLQAQCEPMKPEEKSVTGIFQMTTVFRFLKISYSRQMLAFKLSQVVLLSLLSNCPLGKSFSSSKGRWGSVQQDPEMTAWRNVLQQNEKKKKKLCVLRLWEPPTQQRWLPLCP